MQIGSGPRFYQRFIAYICQELDRALRWRDRSNNVDREAPRIKVEHQIWENKQISGGYLARVVKTGLQTGVSKVLGGVAAVIDDLVQRAVNIGNMKTLEIILAIQCPMSVDLVFAGRGKPQVRVNVFEFRGRIADKCVKRIHRIDRCKHKSALGRERQLPQIIAIGRKILHALKLRHRQELAVKRETPSVITAAYKICLAGLFDQYLSAMSANV